MSHYKSDDAYDPKHGRIEGEESLYCAALRHSTYVTREDYAADRGVVHVDPNPTTNFGHYFFGFCDGYEAGYFDAIMRVPRPIRWLLRWWPHWAYRYGVKP